MHDGQGEHSCVRGEGSCVSAVLSSACCAHSQKQRLGAHVVSRICTSHTAVCQSRLLRYPGTVDNSIVPSMRDCTQLCRLGARIRMHVLPLTV